MGPLILILALLILPILPALLKEFKKQHSGESESTGCLLGALIILAILLVIVFSLG